MIPNYAKISVLTEKKFQWWEKFQRFLLPDEPQYLCSKPWVLDMKTLHLLRIASGVMAVVALFLGIVWQDLRLLLSCLSLLACTFDGASGDYSTTRRVPELSFMYCGRIAWDALGGGY
jgi:hypothetical protein